MATALIMFRWRSHITAWFLVSCCGLSSAGVALCQSGDGMDRVEVSAEDSIEVRRRGDAVEARGKVEVRRRESVFGADVVEIDRSERTLRARGSVYLRDPRYRLQASGLELDLAEETGTILDAEVFIEEGHVSLSGSRVEKFAGQTYRLEDGLFTTCLCEDGTPPWRIGAREIRLGEDGKAAVDDVTFYVYDVPVLYLPRASFPYVTDRATGLLVPSLGWSDQAGLLYRQPLFWAIDKSNDVTLNFAVESKTRVGFTGQYRTIVNAASDGRLDVSYFNERMRAVRSVKDAGIADGAIPEDRWNVLLTHRRRGPSGWATFSDLALYSDSLVPRELMEFSDLNDPERELIRTSRYSASRLGFYRHGSGMTLEGEVDYLQDLVQPQRRALHRLPHVSFSGARRLGRRLDLGWDVAVTRYVRAEWADGLRVDIRPELTWPVTVGRYFRLATSVALRETLYRLDSVDGKFNASRNDFSGTFARNRSRELVEFRSTLATSLSRTYDWNPGGWSRIRHVVEPAVEYRFIPATDQRDIPIWDAIDRINRRNLLTLALTNRFWRRSAVHRNGGGGAGAAARFARARIAGSFDLDQERKGGDGLSNVDIGLGLNPADNLDVVLDLGIDPGPWNLREATLGFALFETEPPETAAPDRDFRRPNGFSLHYRHVRANPLSPLADHANLRFLPDCPGDPRCVQKGPLDAVQASGLLHMTDHLLLLYDGSYDGASGRLTRNQVGVKYLSRCRCWTIAAFVDIQTNPDRTLLSVKFNLLGLGS